MLACERRFWHSGPMVHSRSTLAAVALAMALAACGRQPAAPAGNSATNTTAGDVTPVLPTAKPGLDREQLVIAAMRALTSAALGRDDGEAQKPLRGRDFTLKLRFGCPGVTADPARSWTYDEEKQTLRVRVSADLAAQEVPASDLLLSGYEGVAGFTLGTPLLLSPGCPAAPYAAIGEGGPTIALAQLFTAQDSRVQRPQHAYELTKAAEPAEKPTQGLDLVVSGRLAELRDGRAIHCAAADGAPTCLISAQIDHVAIENPADGTVLGQWSQW